MELDLPYGPWKQLVSAKWGGFPVGIYSNPDKVLLLALFDQRGNETAGMLVALKKAFVADVDLSKAAQAQQRELTAINKFSPAGSNKFVLVGSTPSYCSYSQEALVETIGKQFSELKALAKFVADLAGAHGAKAKDFAAATDEEAQALLGDPFLLFALLNPDSLKRESQESKKTVVAGVDSSGKLSSLPAASDATIIVGGDDNDRLRGMQILLENALLNAVPCIVFDSSGLMKGLAKPNENTREFTRHQMIAMPLGFPTREYRLGNGLYIDLAGVTKELFLEAFGLQGSDAAKTIAAAWGKEKHSVSDLQESVKQLPESSEMTRYLILKTMRCLAVLSKKHSGLFNKNAATDLMAPWHDGIGKVFYVDCSKVPDNVKHLFVYSLLESIPLAKGSKLKAIICFDTEMSKIYPDVLSRLSELRKSGVGFVLHASHEIDAQIVDEPAVKIELAGGTAVASIKGEKPVRFSWRPPYTQPFVPQKAFMENPADL